MPTVVSICPLHLPVFASVSPPGKRPTPWNMLLMVQKSGEHQLRLVVSPKIYKVFLICHHQFKGRIGHLTFSGFTSTSVSPSNFQAWIHAAWQPLTPVVDQSLMPRTSSGIRLAGASHLRHPVEITARHHPSIDVVSNPDKFYRGWVYRGWSDIKQKLPPAWRRSPTVRRGATPTCISPMSAWQGRE